MSFPSTAKTLSKLGFAPRSGKQRRIKLNLFETDGNQRLNSPSKSSLLLLSSLASQSPIKGKESVEEDIGWIAKVDAIPAIPLPARVDKPVYTRRQMRDELESFLRSLSPRIGCFQVTSRSFLHSIKYSQVLILDLHLGSIAFRIYILSEWMLPKKLP